MYLKAKKLLIIIKNRSIELETHIQKNIINEKRDEGEKAYKIGSSFR